MELTKKKYKNKSQKGTFEKKVSKENRVHKKILQKIENFYKKRNVKNGVYKKKSTKKWVPKIEFRRKTFDRKKAPKIVIIKETY